MGESLGGLFLAVFIVNYELTIDLNINKCIENKRAKNCYKGNDLPLKALFAHYLLRAGSNVHRQQYEMDYGWGSSSSFSSVPKRPEIDVNATIRQRVSNYLP
jgi:hypothetical protein